MLRRANTVMMHGNDFEEVDEGRFEESVTTFTTPRKRTRLTYHSN